MSGKQKRDYKKIFNAVKDLLPSIAIKTITIDIEAAMWQTISQHSGLLLPLGTGSIVQSPGIELTGSLP